MTTPLSLRLAALRLAVAAIIHAGPRGVALAAEARERAYHAALWAGSWLLAWGSSASAPPRSEPAEEAAYDRANPEQLASLVAGALASLVSYGPEHETVRALLGAPTLRASWVALADLDADTLSRLPGDLAGRVLAMGRPTPWDEECCVAPPIAPAARSDLHDVAVAPPATCAHPLSSRVMLLDAVDRVTGVGCARCGAKRPDDSGWLTRTSPRIPEERFDAAASRHAREQLASAVASDADERLGAAPEAS